MGITRLSWVSSKNGRWIKAGPFVIEVYGHEDVEAGKLTTIYAIDMRVPGLGLISVGDRRSERSAKKLCQDIVDSMLKGCV